MIVNYILVIFVGVAVTWWQTMRVRVHALPEQEIERLAGMVSERGWQPEQS